MCSYERAGWLGSRDLAKRAGNFAMNIGMNSGGPAGIIFHCLLYFPHHEHPIQLQWYSLKRYWGYDRPESYFFLYFAMFALFLEYSARTLSQDLWPFSSWYLIWTQGETGQPGQPSSCEEALRLNEMHEVRKLLWIQKNQCWWKNGSFRQSEVEQKFWTFPKSRVLFLIVHQSINSDTINLWIAPYYAGLNY